MANDTTGKFHPKHLIYYAGGGYALGGASGALFHFTKGIISSPSGKRFTDVIQAARMNSGKLASRMGVFFGLYQACGCTVVYVRPKEDRWTTVIAAGLASGLQKSRKGLGVASRSALFTAAVWTVMDEAVIRVSKRIKDSM